MTAKIHNSLKELTVDLSNCGDVTEALTTLKGLEIQNLYLPKNKTFICSMQAVRVTFEDVKNSMFRNQEVSEGRQGENPKNLKILQVSSTPNP